MPLTWKTTSTKDSGERDALVNAGWEVYNIVVDEDDTSSVARWDLRISSRDYVDAEQVLTETGSEKPEAQGYDPLEGVDFASDAALELAAENDLGLSEGDFDDVDPSGETGYTKADVESIIATEDE